jgi:hypothetical protein
LSTRKALGPDSHGLELTDAPLVSGVQKPRPPAGPRTYDDALASWKTPEDIMRWVRDEFQYDLERALDFAEDSPASPAVEVYAPRETFNARSGTCIDLCRFAVDTLRAIDSATPVNYLMIDFEPVRIADRTLRRHWLAVYEHPLGLVVFADTKYPGELSKPDPSLAGFVANYEVRRGRRVLGFRLRTTFAKELKTKKRQATAQMAQVSRKMATDGE